MRKNRMGNEYKEFRAMSTVLPLLAFFSVPFLSLSNSIWTIIACCTGGATFITFIGMLVAKSKAKKAAKEAKKLSSNPELKYALEQKKKAVAEKAKRDAEIAAANAEKERQDKIKEAEKEAERIREEAKQIGRAHV